MRSILISIVTALLLVACPACAQAMTGYETGVYDGQEYREVVFLGGKPMVFTGTLKATSKAKDNNVQTTLTYKLKDVAGGGNLSRTAKLESVLQKNGNQDVYTTRLTSLTESIDVGGQKLKLKKDGYFLSASRVVDHRPLVDFSTENWYMKKTYETGRDGGMVIMEASGASEGYDNPWGKGHTATMTINLTSRAVGTQGSNWQGSIEAVLNDTFSRTLRYVPSQPQLISFSGGFLEESVSEETLRATYDLPVAGNDNKLENNLRSRASVSLSLAGPPAQKRLFIKEFRDVRGHWAQQSIEAMCGLGVFSNNGGYFGPGYAARRSDMARGLAILGGMVQTEEPKKKTTSKKAPPVTPVFLDVPPDHPDFRYIEEISRRGVTAGMSERLFHPGEELTRAEAATMLVNSLGLCRLAPAGGYRTPFLDDGQIPAWARDSVFVASQLGLIEGDGGFFRPMDKMTRAELACLFDSLRVYLNRDFRQDYREGIFTFK